MKSINTYIIEKFKIGNDIENDKFEDIIVDIDSSFESAGFKINKDSGDDIHEIYLEKGEIKSDTTRYKHVDYELKFKIDSPKIIIKLAFERKDDDSPIECYCALFYTNGKFSYSVASNVNRTLKYTIPLSKENPNTHTNIYGNKKDFYKLDDNILKKLISGIKELKYFKDEAFEYLNKSRFTTQMWGKLCASLIDIFQ